MRPESNIANIKSTISIHRNLNLILINATVYPQGLSKILISVRVLCSTGPRE
jgi:hypothetical protein